MANEAISAHVVVISQASGKLPDTKGNSLPNAEGGAEFANILAAQIQGDLVPADTPVLTKADSTALDTQDKAANQPDITALTADSEIAKLTADGQNTQPIAYLQGVQVEVHVQVQAYGGDKHDALALDANNVTAKSLSSAAPAASELNAQSGVEKAAKEFADPAKFAASDKSLPIDSLRDVKTEPVSATVTANLAQANRAGHLPATAPPVQTVAVPVGQAGWDAAFSQRVSWVATNNLQVAQLHLNPPNLGPVEVRISLNSDQANAVFTSPHAAVREAIEAALPRLREMLADNGLSLGNVNVSSQSFQQQQQHANGQGNGQRHGPVQELQQGGASDQALGSVVQAGIASVLANKGLVDLFA